MDIWGARVLAKIPEIQVAQRGLPERAGGAVQSLEEATSLGRGISDFASSMQKIAEKDAAAYTVEATSQFALDQKQKFENRKSGDVNTFIDDYSKQFDSDLETLVEAAPNDIAKDLIKQRANQLRTSFISDAITFQTSEKRALQVQGTENATNSLASLITIDPSKYGDAMKAFEGNIAAASMYADPSQKEKLKVDGIGKLNEALIRGNMNDPAKAKELLNNPDIAVTLKPDTILSIDSAIRTREKTIEEEQEKNNAIANVNSVLTTGVGYIDPKDSNQQKAVDLTFQSYGGAAALQALQPDAANLTVSFAQRTGVVPKSAESIVRGYLNMGNFEQKQYAADVITRLEESAPNSLQQFNDKEIAYASMYSKYIRSGAPPESVDKFVTEQMNPLNKQVLDNRKAEFNKVVKKKDFAEEIQNTLGGFFEPSLGNFEDAATIDFRNLYEGFYMQTGDDEVATTLARNSFSRIYGTSDVMGKETVMKYPPEKYYSIPNYSNDWMREQMVNDVKSVEGFKDINEDNIVLFADALTEREASKGSPSYMLFVKDETGVMKEVRDPDGNLLRMQFDPSEELKKINKTAEEFKANKVSAAKKIIKARELQKEYDLKKIGKPRHERERLRKKYLRKRKEVFNAPDSE